MNIDTLLTRWRDETTKALGDGIERLFDASADVMLEYAEKAQNDYVRGRFYEALREARLRREDVSEHFLTGLSRILLKFDASRAPDTPGRADVLSLVDPDDFERGLALQMIAEHAEKDNPVLLRSLSLRLAAVSNTPPLSLDDLPAGPRQITGLFAASASQLQIEHEARLAIYTLFERFIIPETMQQLEVLNERLVEAGVLPDLPTRIAGSKPSRSTAQQDPSAPEATEHTGREDGAEQERRTAGRTPPDPSRLGDETLMRIRDLLAARRAHRVQPGLPAAPPAPMSEVLASITSLPGSPAPTPDSDSAAQLAGASPEALRAVRKALFAQRTQIREDLGEDRVSPDIDDVIEIVGAIFEMMLNERDLPDVVKALLSHLHTPYLKYAVTDPELLAQERHPARVWFDDLMLSGSHWVDPADLSLGLYPWMAKAVREVMSAKQLTRATFEQQRAELSAQQEQQQSKQQRLEKRAGEHARGKARLDEAQDHGQDMLDALLAEHPGAPYVAEFLQGAWLNYLVLLLLRSNNEPDDPAVRGAQTLGREICDASVLARRKAPEAGQEIQKLEKALALTVVELIPHLDSKVRQFLHQLRNPDQGAQTPPPAAARQQAAAKRRRKRDPLDGEEARIATRLRQLPSGTRFWRNAKDDDKTTTTQRLVWFNPQTERFMFADLAGQNAGMVSIKELAGDIAQGRARVLAEERESFISRAMKSFQSLLKQGQETPTKNEAMGTKNE